MFGDNIADTSKANIYLCHCSGQNFSSNPCGPMRFALDCKSIYATHNNGYLAFVARLNLTQYDDAWFKQLTKTMANGIQTF